jgi:XRE family transcriptional regulator, regulator of sulfur utilization
MEINGRTIQKIRNLKGLNQENMAEMLGMSLVAYGDIERGKTKLSEKRISLIAKSLEMTTEQIETFEDKIELVFKNTGDAYGAYNQTNHNYSSKDSDLEKKAIEAQSLNVQNTLLKTQLKLAETEKEKFEIEALYWKEKFEHNQATQR